METRELASFAQAWAESDPPKPFPSVYTGDLLSDVLANAQPQSLIVTMQNVPNTIAVAVAVKASAVLLTEGPGKEDNQDLIDLASSHHVSLYATALDTFHACVELGKL